ncbi:Crp/Fnr family transcriptional regulator [Muricoccus radiodurans]|uniref:Crp/Fnr family transcriptional regulator n=1 Tax=Muricoccus radiodurans TaxID=2231721 RepID=UPI003CF55D5D
MGWDILLNGLGYAAAAATIVSQRMRTMIPLRAAAIAANLLFIAYGAFGRYWPTLILHLILLPLNIERLIGMLRLVKRIRFAAQGDFNADWLRPYTRRCSMPAGTLIWRQGEIADTALYLLSGEVRYRETGRVVGPGHFVGDLGIFAADRQRTLSSECTSDVEALAISYDELTQLYFQNPKFGFYLVQTIIRNLRGHIAALEAKQAGALSAPPRETPPPGPAS